VQVQVHYRGGKKSPFKVEKNFALRPAEPSRDGQFLAPHITKSRLVNLKETTDLDVRSCVSDCVSDCDKCFLKMTCVLLFEC
jgi:hypothetical protein